MVVDFLNADMDEIFIEGRTKIQKFNSAFPRRTNLGAHKIGGLSLFENRGSSSKGKDGVAWTLAVICPFVRR